MRKRSIHFHFRPTSMKVKGLLGSQMVYWWIVEQTPIINDELNIALENLSRGRPRKVLGRDRNTSEMQSTVLHCAPLVRRITNHLTGPRHIQE